MTRFFLGVSILTLISCIPKAKISQNHLLDGIYEYDNVSSKIHMWIKGGKFNMISSDDGYSFYGRGTIVNTSKSISLIFDKDYQLDTLRIDKYDSDTTPFIKVIDKLDSIPIDFVEVRYFDEFKKMLYLESTNLKGISSIPKDKKIKYAKISPLGFYSCEIELTENSSYQVQIMSLDTKIWTKEMRFDVLSIDIQSLVLRNKKSRLKMRFTRR